MSDDFGEDLRLGAIGRPMESRRGGSRAAGRGLVSRCSMRSHSGSRGDGTFWLVALSAGCLGRCPASLIMKPPPFLIVFLFLAHLDTHFDLCYSQL